MTASTNQTQEAIDNRIRVVQTMYDKFPINTEQTTSAQKIAADANSSYNVVQTTLTALERAGIISRRIGYREGFQGGRQAFVTLNKPIDDAIECVKEEWQAPNESIKERALIALSNVDKPLSTKELSYALHLNGGSTDFHNLTHVLHALKRQGKITFLTDSTKDKIPYNIRMVNASKIHEQSSPVERVSPAPIVVADEPENVSHLWASPEVEPEVSVIDFPMARKMLSRMTILQQAATLAEQGEAEDIAILLQDRLTMTDLEKEHIALYNAYMECVKS